MFIEWLRARWFWWGRWLCRVFCLVFFRLRTYGQDNIPAKGPFIMVSNHQSYLDPIFCGAPIKRHMCFVARDSLFKVPLLGFLISSVNTIPLRRNKGDLSAMRKVLAHLRQGSGVCLFPEGTRSSDGRIATLKTGFSLLCRRGNAPIVPVSIDGAFECWPRQKLLFSPGRVDVCYGKPIPAEKAKKMDGEKFAQLVTDVLRRMHNDCRLKSGKKPYNYINQQTERPLKKRSENQ